MPIYVYRCGSCGSEVEARQSFDDAPLTTCQSCGGTQHRVPQPLLDAYVATPKGQWRPKYKEAIRKRGNWEGHGGRAKFEENKHWVKERNRRNAEVMARAEAKKRRLFGRKKRRRK